MTSSVINWKLDSPETEENILPTLDKMTPNDFQEVYKEFLRADDPCVSVAEWQRLFRLYAATEFDHCGYLLRDGDKVVGMLGTIMSRRVIAGRSELFCNLHSWYVQPNFRGHSLQLLRPVLSMSGVTITDLTPTPQVYDMSLRLGLVPLDSTLRVLLPCLPRKRRHTDVTALCGLEIPDNLSPAIERALATDHHDAGLQEILLTDGNRQCYLLAARIERHRVSYCYVHFMSDPALFCEWSRIARVALLNHVGGRFVAVDDRLLGGKTLSSSLRVPVQTRQLFRSTSVDAEHIDTLYSEVSLLNLTTLPNLRGGLFDFARRFRPRRKIRSKA